MQMHTNIEYVINNITNFKITHLKYFHQFHRSFHMFFILSPYNLTPL